MFLFYFYFSFNFFLSNLTFIVRILRSVESAPNFYFKRSPNIAHTLVKHIGLVKMWKGRTGWEELNWKRLDKMCTVILVKTALTKEFVTGKVYEDQAEQNKLLTNK